MSEYVSNMHPYTHSNTFRSSHTIYIQHKNSPFPNSRKIVKLSIYQLSALQENCVGGALGEGRKTEGLEVDCRCTRGAQTLTFIAYHGMCRIVRRIRMEFHVREPGDFCS
eukprot:261721-Amorphochlora_amoeboformis.AAC.1